MTKSNNPTNTDLDSKTMKNIRKALGDIKKGRVYTLKQVEKDLEL